MTIEQVVKEIVENKSIPKKDYAEVLQQYLKFFEESREHVDIENINKGVEFYDNLKEEYSLKMLRCYIKEKYCK